MRADFEEYRMGHLMRTAEVWKRLCELGVTEETPLDFDFEFSASFKSAVEALRDELNAYPIEISSEGIIRKTYRAKGNSGAIAWTEEQLLKWVDYLIAVGEDSGCDFEGCGASAP
jgi:hypothetical protein